MLDVQQTGIADLLYVSGQQFHHERCGHDEENPDDKKQIIHFFVGVHEDLYEFDHRRRGQQGADCGVQELIQS